MLQKYEMETNKKETIREGNEFKPQAPRERDEAQKDTRKQSDGCKKEAKPNQKDAPRKRNKMHVLYE